ncbi:MAG TPA: hypothetical protein RMG45_22350, partial [Polyangiaceae bacterium LLY-WYZ-15_(1-7)]|nr:hypothetical protein [Polyangiaceae bacterium LLY-WYZ-15_(1-7)]
MDSVDDVRLRTSRGPLLAFVVLVVAGIATGAWALFFREATRPTAVLVGVSGCSEACVDNLGRRLRFHLEGHGLEVLPGEEDESADARLASVRSLDELTSLATELGAAHALLITVEPLAQRPGILGEGSVALVARVRGRTLTRGEDTREPHDLVFAVETTSEDRARMQAGRRGVDALADALAAEILGSGPVEAWREGAPSAHEYERYEDVGEAVRGLEARARGKAEFEAACEASAEALAAEGPLGATCLTRGCGEEYLVGVAPDGQWAVVREETGAPVFPIGNAADVRRAETPERLVRVPLDGSPRQTLVATDNLYSYATLSEDGRALAYVELADRVAVLVWQDVETGERRILRAVEAPERLLFPHVSPDGAWVSYAYRPFRRGEAQTFVAPADGGPGYEPVRFGSNGRWVRLRPPPREDAAGAAEGDAETASEPEPEVLLAVVVPGIAEAPAEEGAGEAEGAADPVDLRGL